jgi:CHAT domain-containing protein
MVGFYATSAWDFNYLSHYAAALEFEKQALHLAEQINNPLAVSRYQVQMGLIHGMLKNYDQAIQNIRLGIDAGASVGQETIREEITSYGQLELGRAYRESGQIEAALASLAGAESYTQKNGEQVWLLHEVKKEQLLAKIAQGDVTGAQQELARVIAAYEDQRERVLEESNRKSFFDREQSIYDVAVDFALTQLGNAQQAFDYSESSRARSLLDTSTGDWRVADEDKTPDLRFSSASKPRPLDQIRVNLPPRAQLLQFAVLKDKLIIWYVSRERFEHAVVNISSDALMDKVDRLLALVTTPPRDNSNQLQTIAAELYNLLIAPVAQFLDQGKQLCIVPDKILNLLPFNVLLSSSQRYLIQDFALSYASSANLFVRDSELATTKERASERLLGVGNPSFDRTAFPELADLPSASKEVEGIVGLYGPSSLLLRGPDAKKSAVLSAIRDVDVLHLASHYLPDTASPMMSKLILAGNSREPSDTSVLHPYEIYRLKPLRVRLAVLAGCRTGVEGYVNGEGAIGLGRPFSAAGVPLVVASLWSVDSQATTELMIEFHRLRKQKSLSSAQALQAAQVQMLQNGNTNYRSPYYWASFSLTGGYSDY